jgi:hypothetical protein
VSFFFVQYRACRAQRAGGWLFALFRNAGLYIRPSACIFTGTHVRHGPGLTWNVVGLENALVTKEREWALDSQRAALGVVVDDSQHLGVLDCS